MKAVLKILLIIVSSTFAIEKVYNGFKVYDIKPGSEDDLKFLQNFDTLEGDARSLDFLSFHNNVDDVVRLLVKPEEQNYIEDLFKSQKLNFKVSIDNVQE